MCMLNSPKNFMYVYDASGVKKKEKKERKKMFKQKSLKDAESN